MHQCVPIPTQVYYPSIVINIITTLVSLSFTINITIEIPAEPGETFNASFSSCSFVSLHARKMHFKIIQIVMYVAEEFAPKQDKTRGFVVVATC